MFPELLTSLQAGQSAQHLSSFLLHHFAMSFPSPPVLACAPIHFTQHNEVTVHSLTVELMNQKYT